MTHTGFPVTLDGETFTEAEFTANGGTAYRYRLPQMLNAAAADLLAKQTAALAAQGSAEAAELNAISQAAAALASAAAAQNYAAAAQNYAAALNATSTTSLAIGTGSKTFTTQSGKQFAVGQFIVAVDAASSANYMHGQVTSYSGATLVIDVQSVGGSGTIANWNIFVAGNRGATGPGITPQTTGFTATGGTTPKTLTVDEDLTASSLAQRGKQTIWIPAGAMKARTTGGAAAGTVETTTNKVMLQTLDFDAATAEYAQFAIRMPKGWNESAVTAYFLWSSAVSGTNAVVFGLQAVALSDDDALDAAFGTAQTVTDAQTAQGDMMQTAETSAITVAGTPAAGDWVVFQVYRNAASGSDTLAGDARLHGVVVIYTTDAANDA
jgi:hypothetical protein